MLVPSFSGTHWQTSTQNGLYQLRGNQEIIEKNKQKLGKV